MFYHMYWLGPIGGVLSIIFWVMVIALIFSFFRSNRPWQNDYSDTNHRRITPEDILSERFAKGEIDEKEYKERMEVLKKI